MNEHRCLVVADQLGLDAAETTVRWFGAERALVVCRYDRVFIDGQIVRVHQEDVCQALSVHPTHKYQSDGGPGVADVVRLLDTVVPGDSARDIAMFCRAVAYNWLLLGTDGHAKNYSLLLAAGQVRLAPLYDIASAAPYDIHPRKLRLAQKVGGEYKPTVITERRWARLARDANRDPDHFLNEVRVMADDLPDALTDAISATDLTGAGTVSAGHLLDRVAA